MWQLTLNELSNTSGLRDAKHSASYTNSVSEIQVEYLDKSDILVPKLDDAI